MRILNATIGSSGLSSPSQLAYSPHSSFFFLPNLSPKRVCPLRVSVSNNGVAEQEPSQPLDSMKLDRRSADWKAARTYYVSGHIYEGIVVNSNSGGLLVRFYSILGFLPYSQLSPSHSCKEPKQPLRELAKSLIGSTVCVKVVKADEENQKLIFSEKQASWLKYSEKISVGDVFDGKVGSVEDYGAFVHLRFPDGVYHLTGMVNASEVSWDWVRDVRDVLNVGDGVRVKVVNIDKKKLRVMLSIKLLEKDPLLQTLDEVIPQNGSASLDDVGSTCDFDIAPLPGLETILEELRQEDGIDDVRICQQGFEKRVVSQDLQLWLSNAPPVNKQFTLLARAGRQVQEILMSTSLDQEGIKRALQRVLERVL